jgi:hypothetical protein
VANRELDVLAARLAAIEVAARSIGRQLVDLHGIAYERAVTGGDRVGGGTDAGVETHGDERARHIWRRLEGAIERIETHIKALDSVISNLLSKGGSVEETRGSLIPKREFRAALKQQKQRDARGEYTPHRTLEQPDYPAA